MVKTTKEVTKDILDVEFEDMSKSKLFDDNGYMEDQDSAREDDSASEDDMEDSDVAEVVPISKDKGPLEKDVYPQGRRDKFKNNERPNPYDKRKV
jgi:hypothetical protein